MEQLTAADLSLETLVIVEYHNTEVQLFEQLRQSVTIHVSAPARCRSLYQENIYDARNPATALVHWISLTDHHQYHQVYFAQG